MRGLGGGVGLWSGWLAHGCVGVIVSDHSPVPLLGETVKGEYVPLGTRSGRIPGGATKTTSDEKATFAFFTSLEDASAPPIMAGISYFDKGERAR